MLRTLFFTLLVLGISGIAFAQEAPTSLLDQASPAYGSGCGIAVKDPEPRIQLENMLAAKDVEGVAGWLNSPIKVYQVYAVEGLHRLYKAGYQPTEKQLARVRQIQTDESKVTTCSGCLYGSESVKSLTAGYIFEQT